MNAIEPATPSRRITWFTLLGLVLVPVAIGGSLLWGLWDPTTRLGQVTAAVVNLDEGTEVDGQTVPLGRQLAAGLVTAEESNFTWVITDEEDASAGLESGGYATVVTIPEDFSERALSFTGDAADAVQATLDIATTDRSRLVDGAISATITSTATTLFNRQSATTYVEGLLGGYTELNEQLGTAADGASELADGQQQLAEGADGLASGLGTLSTGTAGLADGLGTLASGATASADGAQQLAAGSRGVADGATTFAEQLGQLSGGAATAGESARGAAQSTASIVAALQAFQGLETCDFATDPTCVERLLGAVQGLPDPSILESLATDIATTDVALNGSSPLAPGTSVTGLVQGSQAAASGAGELAAGAGTVAGGTQDLADGLGALASGAGASASGAQELASGTAAIADGATGLAEGAQTAADGGAELADGLQTAVDQVPTYTEDEAARLAAAGVEPIESEAPGADLFGASGVPLFAAIAIWLGALAAYLLLRPVTSRALASTRSSLRLALGGYLPGLIIGVVQGLALGAVMLPVLEVTAAASVGFLAFAALAGAAFAAVNQGLAGLLGGIGRFLSMLVAVVALAAGIVSTVPPVFDAVLDVLPLTAAIDGLRAIAEGSAGAGPAVAALVAWLLLGLALTVLAVARRRSAPLGALRSRPVAAA